MPSDRNTAIDSSQILKHTIQLDDISPDSLCWNEPVIDRDLTSPPASPSEGDRYIVASSFWDLLDEDCAGIDDWVDNDSINGESTQVTFDTKSCFKFDTNTAITDNDAERTRSVSIPDNYTVEFNLYLDAISVTTNDSLHIDIYNGTMLLRIHIASDRFSIHDGFIFNEIGTDLPVQDTWQKWRIEVTGGVAESATCDVYLNDDLKASNVDCSYASAISDSVMFRLRGWADNDRIVYLDYIKIGTGTSTGWIGQENKVTQYISSAWSFYTSLEGWITWVKDENKFYYNNGSSWNEIDLSKLHTQNTDTDLDATYEATFVKKTDTANVLSDITSTGANIEDAVTKKHTVNEDTALGSQSEDLNMNTHKITGVVNPVSDQDAETKKHVEDTYSPIASPTFTTKITTPIIDLTGGQIAFPATAVPSADPNTLDDYEEGSWTPDLQFGGNKVGITYTTQVGTYTKIGNSITVRARVVLSSKGSSVGNATIKSMPFSSDNFGGITNLLFKKIAFADNYSGYSNATYLYLTETTNAGVFTYLTNANFADDSQIYVNSEFKEA